MSTHQYTHTYTYRYFGERESSFATLGLVPSVAEDGKYVRAGQGQINAVGATIKKIKKRKEAKKKGEVSVCVVLLYHPHIHTIFNA